MEFPKSKARAIKRVAILIPIPKMKNKNELKDLGFFLNINPEKSRIRGTEK